MLRVDLHLHSHYSHDGRSSLPELIERAHECRLDRIALTDHNSVEGALNLVRLAPELAIAGEEAKTLEGEVIGLFITSRVPPFLAPEEAMDLIHGMGGLTYIPHPLDRHRANFRPARLVELAPRIDIIESYNPWCDASANRAAAQLAEDLGKAQATGSDSHSADELGKSWMEMDDYTSTEEEVGKPIGQDIREGFATLPLLLASIKLDDDRRLQEDEVRRVVDAVRASDGPRRALDQARGIAAGARAQVSTIGESEASSALAALADYVVSRKL